MDKKPRFHLIRTLVFFILFLAAFFATIAPYLHLEKGSLLEAILMPLNDVLFGYTGFFAKGPLAPYSIVPLMILFQILSVMSFLDTKVLTMVSTFVLYCGLFIVFGFTQNVIYYPLLFVLPVWFFYIGLLLIMVSILYFTYPLFFKHREPRRKKVVKQQDKEKEIQMSDKDIELEKAIKGMSHDDALDIINSTDVPDFVNYPNYSERDLIATKETSIAQSLFDEVSKIREFEQENRHKREEVVVKEKNLDNEDVKNISLDDSLVVENQKEINEPPKKKNPVFSEVKTRAVEDEEVDLESEDISDEDLEEGKSKSENIDVVSGVGGLKRSKDGTYFFNPKKYTYKFPSETFLKHYPSSSVIETSIENDPDGKIIVDTLTQFKIDTKLVGIQHGPTFTLYELVLAKGIRVNAVLTLADNIAMELAVQSVRILAPIPGKNAIGIEVPNRKRDTIGFDEMMKELNSKAKKTRIPMVLGKTITGDRIVVDLASAPHMLIAGTTGSGKSVCVNSLICSVLYTKTPREVRMILVDPKMVELTVYNDIPHLLTPVITDPKKAIKAMAFVIDEMKRRMALFSLIGARKIEDYNEKIKEKELAREQLPYIMVIIDEFADLMMVVGKELENYIKTITAVARFTGIHLVLATQRPSSDVITGIIKSNMPTQIAFAVSNQINSRIILDSVGAEKLLGRGDMLYASASDRTPKRIQGAYIDSEIEDIVSFVKTQGEPDYIDESYFEDDESDDEDSVNVVNQNANEDMFTRAWRIVADRGEASASYLQRRMSIGYNRAANLIEQLEDAGCIGPARGSKPREILKYPDSSIKTEDLL